MCPGLRNGLLKTPAELLHLVQHYFATGWNGKIVWGTYEGQSIVVKLAVQVMLRWDSLWTIFILMKSMSDSFRCICSTHVNFVVCSSSHERGFSLSLVEGVLEKVCTTSSFIQDHCWGNNHVHCHRGIQRLWNWNGYVTNLAFCVLLNS